MQITTAPGAEQLPLPASTDAPGPAAPARAAIDWEAAIRLPAFTELRRRRRRFVAPAAIGAFAWITLWLVLVAYAHRFMGHQIIDGVSVMLVTGLSQFVLVWILAAGYLRRARRDWAPLQRRAIQELEAMLTGERA
ncbi:hypothetical protein DSM104299_05256 [Baekduia alba]|uniref:DUF485 domain-containing protein n=1 Tax=Baekduia alba TaxID=2997333 RepID=UPI0023414E67|nr:DUF485 domain-containing protein [Baekduia alba]WCB96497.1 hypothetical protein DSM104299_05256 [Baekduia alba]